MHKRRKLLIALGASALAAPLISLAQQQGKTWRVGVLAPRRVEPGGSDEYYGPFRLGMRELGYVEGKNLVIEWRAFAGRAESLPALAAELVTLKVDVIVAVGTTAIAAAQRASSTIPIVMGTSADPISTGFVKSLARPGGNITGLSNLGVDLGPKQLELLRSMVPKLSSVCVLLNPANASTALVLKSVQAAAQKVGLKVLPLEARTPEGIEKAFSVMAEQKAGAVIVTGDGLFIQQIRQIVELAGRSRLPSIFARSENVEAGGLMSYGQNRSESMFRAAAYVDKIFKGANPGDLPVEQPTRVELVINGKTAKALGLAIPQSLLISADRVIQ